MKLANYSIKECENGRRARNINIGLRALLSSLCFFKVQERHKYFSKFMAMKRQFKLTFAILPSFDVTL